jgi:F-type H+-transporting ATPase subunit delta
MSELATLARPYAEAIAELAKQDSSFDKWSEDLTFLQTVVESPQLKPLVKMPSGGEKLVKLILDISQGQISDAAKNLVRVLADNQRLAMLSHVAVQYEALKAQHKGYIKVELISAYAVQPEQQQEIEASLQKSLGKSIEVSISTDPSLIGGMLIRAGDKVTDLTVKGRLQQLAAELRH